MMEASELGDDPSLDENGRAEENKASQEGEHHSDTSKVGVGLTDSVKLFARCASINSMIVGYDRGITIHVGKLVQDAFGLSDLERGVFIASFFAFMVFGALGSPFISDRYGSRAALVVSSYVFLIGALMMALADSYHGLLIGRIFAGVGAGLGYGVDAQYIAEIAPASHRGELVTWSYIAVAIGLVLGVSMGILFSWLEASTRWRVMIGLGMGFPVAVIVTSVKVLVESPRFLVLNHRTEQAKQTLAKLYPKDYIVEPILKDMKEALHREQIAEGTIGWTTMLRPTPAFRRMLLLGFGISFAEQAIGVDVILYYSLDILEETGLGSVTMQNVTLVGMVIIKLQCIVISSRVFDFTGRRDMLFLSLSGLAASLFLLGLAFTPNVSDDLQPLIAACGLAAYVAFYGLGLGPLSRLIPSEIFPTGIRAKALSISVLISRGTGALMSVYFISLKDALSWHFVFVTLAGICVFLELLFFFYLPETRGHALEDMSLLFAEVTNDTKILDAERKLRGDEFMGNFGGGGGTRRKPFSTVRSAQIARV